MGESKVYSAKLTCWSATSGGMDLMDLESYGSDGGCYVHLKILQLRPDFFLRILDGKYSMIPVSEIVIAGDLRAEI